MYGIVNSNRDFSNPDYWGKNQFNSSFPVALACFMRDSNLSAVYLRLNAEKKIFHEELSITNLFGSELPNERLYFSFESRFDPYRRFVHDELKTIDLVVKEAETGRFLRPLEIKLTTLPDEKTAKFSEDKYGCEIVVRPPTIRYMALSMANSLENRFHEVREIFEPVCITVRDWGNPTEINEVLPGILSSLETFISTYRNFEQPLLMQPVWKTLGKSPVLADNCLDIFVWSDFALTRTFVDSAIRSKSSKISRQKRAVVRLARFLFEVSRTGRVFQEAIWDVGGLGNQTDKEFSIPGASSIKYMTCSRLTRPIVRKNQIQNIILDGGQKYLSPERRFDAILYFSSNLFEE